MVTRPSNPPLKILAKKTNHTPEHAWSRVKQTSCGNRLSDRDTSLRQWLQCPCPKHKQQSSGRSEPAPCNTAMPQVLASEPRPKSTLAHVGNNQTHFTQVIYTYRVLFHCTVCGYIATNQARGLTNPCNVKGLRRTAKGFLRLYVTERFSFRCT